jgi:hypothetical protein
MCQERAKIAHSEAKQRKAGHGEDVGSARSTDHRVLVVEEGGVLPELPLDAREVAGAHEAVDGLGLGRPRSPVLATWHRHLLVPPPSLPSRSLLSERVWARSSGCVLCGEEPSRRGRTGGPSGTNPSDVPCPPFKNSSFSFFYFGFILVVTCFISGMYPGTSVWLVEEKNPCSLHFHRIVKLIEIRQKNVMIEFI